MAAKDNVPKNAWTKLNEAEEQADPFGYLAALLSDDGLGRYSDRFQQLQHMIAERIASDREGFLDQLLDQVTGTISYCIVRMGAALTESISRHDGADAHRRRSPLPPDVADTLMPRLQETVGQLLELEQVRATLARQRELARAKRLENDRVTRRRSTKRQRKCHTAESSDSSITDSGRPLNGRSSRKPKWWDRPPTKPP